MRWLPFSGASQQGNWGGVGPGGEDQCVSEVATVYTLEIIC